VSATPDPIAYLWGAWALCWLIAARRAKAVARRGSLASRLGHLFPLAIAILLLGVRHVPGWLGTRWVEPSDTLEVIGIVLVAAGLLFSVWARIALGGNWSGTVTLKEGHALVRSGPYRLLRHPIYTGLLVALAGSAIALGQWRGWLAVLIAAAALWRKLRIEERWLLESFGAEYAAYHASTWALIPFVL
jgi:protein-S-isoprenylcysteine O-methyltransferase Ste14